jgi:3-hydroxybutyryl-CoA dehydrogenase
MAAIVHGIRTVGIIGAGQMGTGIALVSALRAKVPVKLYDKSSEQVTKGLAFMDKLLEKDVSKGRIQSADAKEARDRVSTVNSISGFKDVDMVIEVC